MANNKLILRTLNSPWTYPTTDVTKNSVLTHTDVDNNFIYLKGEVVYSAMTSGTDLILNKINSSNITIDMSSLVTAGDTFVSGATFQSGYTGTTLILSRTDGGTVEADMSSTLTYTNSNPTLVDVGGVEEGSTFSTVSMQDMWTDLLYPELTPKFTSFDLAGVGTLVEVGYTISAGSQTFNWVTSNSSFIQPNSVRLRDISGGITFTSGTVNDGTEVVTFPVNVQKTAQSSHTWRIDANRLNGTNFYRNHLISWYWRRFWGSSTDTTLDEAGVEALSSALSNGRVGTFSFPASATYKYFAWPDAFGNADLSRDEATNLQIAMAGPSDGYNNYDGEYYYDTETITNVYGISTTYRIYRTKNILGGSIDIIVS